MTRTDSGRTELANTAAQPAGAGPPTGRAARAMPGWIRLPLAAAGGAVLAVLVLLVAIWLFYDPDRAPVAAASSLFIAMVASLLFGITTAAEPTRRRGTWLARLILERLAIAAVAVVAVALVAGFGFDGWAYTPAGLVLAAAAGAGWTVSLAVLVVRATAAGPGRRMLGVAGFLAILLTGGVMVPPLTRWPVVGDLLGWLPPLPVRGLFEYAFAGPAAGAAQLAGGEVAGAAAMVAGWIVLTGLVAWWVGRPVPATSGGGAAPVATSTDGSGDPAQPGAGKGVKQRRGTEGTDVAAAVTVAGLKKRYGDKYVVNGVDLEVLPGEVFAILGPNGAGKTTTVEILEGQRNRTSGAVDVLGFDPWTGGRRFRERIGVVLQSAGLTLELTLAETVELYRGYYPAPRTAHEVIELVGLTEQRNHRISRLSGGQLRRLDLALALVGDPELVFLDEPTTGFDPQIRAQAWESIEALAAGGKTIILTTHYMEEAARLADRVAIMYSGRIISTGAPATMTALSEHSSVVTFCLPDGLSADQLPVGLRGATTRDGFFRITVAQPEPLLNELTGWALAGGHRLRGLSVERPTLEDVYLDLIDDADRSIVDHETANR